MITSLSQAADKRQIEFHPFAGMFPKMGESELASLSRDIQAHGLREPVWLYEGKVLDGRNRWQACLIADVQPSIREFVGTREEALAFVRSENLERRHLSSRIAGCEATDGRGRIAEAQAGW